MDDAWRRRTRIGWGFVCLAVLTGPGTAWAWPTDEDPPPNVRITEAFAQMAVRVSLARAARRLGEPGCQGLLTEFSDAAGHPLRATLDARGFRPETYFQHMRFYDGTVHPHCAADGVYAVTLHPGSRLVYVCSVRFLATFKKDPGLAEAYLIHEMLHSLGLGESPPSTKAITERVIDLCRP